MGFKAFRCKRSLSPLKQNFSNYIFTQFLISNHLYESYILLAAITVAIATAAII
ncbi:MAG: hypothetical protein KME23_01855 [Goleter apudmare HA4340-LM2]|nr:hypothetical protein [Goleter apudmare HA4340-LM2]